DAPHPRAGAPVRQAALAPPGRGPRGPRGPGPGPRRDRRGLRGGDGARRPRCRPGAVRARGPLDGGLRLPRGRAAGAGARRGARPARHLGQVRHPGADRGAARARRACPVRPVRRGVAPTPAEDSPPRQGRAPGDSLHGQGDGPRRRPRGFRAAGEGDYRPPGQARRPVGHLLPDPRAVRRGRRPHAPAPAPGARRRDTGGAPVPDRGLRPPLHPRTTGGRHARHARVAQKPHGPARGVRL
ncbi:MAG: Beta-ketoadipate enol-lactone hydrolase, partial [uncultured Thermomicrobiales bacterium]